MQHAVPRHHPRQIRGTGPLDALLWLYPGTELVTWSETPGRAIVDFIRIPEDRRRQGIGTMVYRAWERSLDPGTVVWLFAVDAAAKDFWSSLGFVDVGDGGMKKTLVPGRCAGDGPARTPVCDPYGRARDAVAS